MVTEVMQFVVGIVVIAPYLVTRTWAWRSAAIAAGGVMMAAAWPLHDVFFLVPVAIGAIVYAAALLMLRVLDDDQQRMVGQVLGRIGIRTRWAP